MDEKLETKIRILKSAKEEFAEFGYDGARMGAIAERANVNQALLYYYYKSKDKLYNGVLQHYLFIDDERLIRDRVADWNLTREQELFMGIYLMVNFSLETIDAEINRIILREVAEGRRHLNNIISNYILPRMMSFQVVIQRGIDEGIFETIDSHMVVMQLIVFVITYTNTGLSGVEKDDKEKLFRFLLEHTVKGLTPVGKVVTIPEFSVERLEALDGVIMEIKKMRTDSFASSGM